VTGARHLLRLLEKNLGLKGRLLQKLQDALLRAHPTAFRDAAGTDTEETRRLQQIYMTRDGMERLRAEHDRIVNQDLPTNAAEIARAREFGDLRENAEYHAARERQSLLQARADAIKADLTRAVPITREIVRTDAVSVGTRVRLRDRGGEERTYTLLGPPDAAAERGVISYLTPLGQALMGRRPGDRVQLDLGGDVRDLEVLQVDVGVPE
jgi:transcription elongation factor GreA